MNEIEYFDSEGHPLNSFGRTGGGVNGFRAASWIGRCHGDSVFVRDLLANRVVVLAEGGSFGREYRQSGNAASMVCSRSGSVAVLMDPARMETPRLTGAAPRQIVKLYFGDLVGDTIGQIARVEFAENRPLGRETHLAFARNRLYVGTADSAFVDIYSLEALDGKKLGALRVTTRAPRTPAGANYQAAITEAVAGLTSESDRDRGAKYLERIPPPALLPPYSGLFGSTDGTIWVNVSALGDPLTILRAYSATGTLVGEVQLPALHRILEIGPGHILASRGADGDDRVVLYRLHIRK